ncbi:uncharacterized protein LOC127838186 [Dreissena polymorpha]|uniref:Uncharacterized protein n=1 Tax=Dreissena polymorpha TaxID=45954 RepID=A0A9D4FKY5_DREPO|nr:uncharacterized protein LOC127838186 [Dreissena polymorpha]KAH3799529.1 hypothetical protein DPMN_153139 [Dreissena polymorpha]KAH3799667.1 hypothetical protein DPMN_153279 [Dreissena polymorpha]
MPFEIGGKGDPMHVTYKYVLNNDIRYMYSGYPLRYNGRQSPDYPNFDMLRLARESSDLKRKTLQISRFTDQNPFTLPRAPAFRDYSRHMVNGIVERLLTNTPRSSTSSLGKSYEDRRCVSQLREPLKKDMYPSYRSLSPEQVKTVSNRLYHTHTHMSNLKARDRDEVRNTLPIMKNKPDPDGIRRKPHRMHTHPWNTTGMPAVDT